MFILQFMVVNLCYDNNNSDDAFRVRLYVCYHLIDMGIDKGKARKRIKEDFCGGFSKFQFRSSVCDIFTQHNHCPVQNNEEWQVVCIILKKCPFHTISTQSDSFSCDGMSFYSCFLQTFTATESCAIGQLAQWWRVCPTVA